MATAHGLLAIGGDLSPQRLLAAYRNGIFPWYTKGEPILWWSPDPRLVLFPPDIHVPRSLARLIRRRPFSLTMDRDFRGVIRSCADISLRKQDDTWITPEMMDAYLALHAAGYAHSIEVWQEGHLVGGIYGIALGRCFFGESMFSAVTNASKVALVYLADFFLQQSFRMIDCQVATEHLQRFGARTISRSRFCRLLSVDIQRRPLAATWNRYDDCLGAGALVQHIMGAGPQRRAGEGTVERAMEGPVDSSPENRE